MVTMIRFLVLLTIAAGPLVSAEKPALSGEQARQIEQAVTAAMSQSTIPGVSVAVAGRNGLYWANGYGLADLENLVPVTPMTEIRLGSISKPITAVAVLQLVEKGKIDLDATVQKYVPSFPAKQWPVTIRELLGHLGGIRHYRGAEELNSTRHYTDRITPLKIFEDDPLLFEPGTNYTYSTYGFNVLGAVVEAASGSEFVAYLREHIFRTAGMDHIGADDVYALIPHRARGYRLNSKSELENCALADTSNKIPAGGMISTATDLVNFALALNEGKLVKPETAHLMFTPQLTRDGKSHNYGMGDGGQGRGGWGRQPFRRATGHFDGPHPVSGSRSRGGRDAESGERARRATGERDRTHCRGHVA